MEISSHILFSWMSWMSTTTTMTFISISEMHIVSSLKKYSLPTRELWVHTTSNVLLWIWQKEWYDILPFFVLPSHGECSSRVGCNCEKWIYIPTFCYLSSEGEISYKKINDQLTSFIGKSSAQKSKSWQCPTCSRNSWTWWF